MKTIQKKLIKLIKKNSSEAFWEMDNLDYLGAMLEFFDECHIDLSEADFEILETKEWEDINGEKWSSASFGLDKYSLVIHLTAFYDSKWYFTFEKSDTKEKPVNVVPIKEDMIVDINGEKCVLYLFEYPAMGNKIYAIPVDVAETLNISEYDHKEIYEDDEILGKIDDFKLPFFSSYNTQ